MEQECLNCKYCSERKGNFIFCMKKRNRVNINKVEKCTKKVEKIV